VRRIKIDPSNDDIESRLLDLMCVCLLQSLLPAMRRCTEHLLQYVLIPYHSGFAMTPPPDSASTDASTLGKATWRVIRVHDSLFVTVTVR